MFEEEISSRQKLSVTNSSGVHLQASITVLGGNFLH